MRSRANDSPVWRSSVFTRKIVSAGSARNYRFTDGGKDVRGGARVPDLEGLRSMEALRRELKRGEVDDFPFRILDVGVADVPDHADDLARVGPLIEPLPDRVPLEMPRHALADDDDLGRLCSVAFVELTAGEEGDTQRSEVSRRDVVERGPDALVLGQCLAADTPERRDEVRVVAGGTGR